MTFRLLVLTSLAMVAAGTGTAAATTVTYSGDGSTVIVTGVDNANHDIQFRLSQDGNNDEIIDTAGFTSIPGDCSYLSGTWVSCPGHNNLRVDLGGGSDDVTFASQGSDCFNDYVLNLGEGANELTLFDGCPTDPASTATVTSGAGPDVLRGGNQSAFNVSAGGGDDSVYGGSGNDALHGGGGNDRLFGAAGNDQVLGEDGADAPNGGAGNDTVDGGPGDDGLELCSSCAGSGNDAGLGADAYIGGTGADKLWLDGHTGGMTITVDGQANDGIAGEGDNVGGDIETILGTTGNDVITGTAGTDVIEGNSGNDEIHGAGGADDLNGGGGDDKLFGDDGADKVQGSSGADTVDGGAGADQLYGDTAACSVFCTFDADTLLARDGEKDSVDCGGGADSAVVDSVDVVAFCASVDRPAAGPAPGGTGPGTTPGGAAMTFGVRTLATPRIARPLRLEVSCSAACTYVVSVVLSAKTARKYRLGSRATRIGSARGALLSAGKKAARLTLSAKARKRLRRAASVPASLRITATDSAGKATTKSQSIRLRR